MTTKTIMAVAFGCAALATPVASAVTGSISHPDEIAKPAGYGMVLAQAAQGGQPGQGGQGGGIGGGQGGQTGIPGVAGGAGGGIGGGQGGQIGGQFLVNPAAQQMLVQYCINLLQIRGGLQDGGYPVADCAAYLMYLSGFAPPSIVGGQSGLPGVGMPPLSGGGPRAPSGSSIQGGVGGQGGQAGAGPGGGAGGAGGAGIGGGLGGGGGAGGGAFP